MRQDLEDIALTHVLSGKRECLHRTAASISKAHRDHSTVSTACCNEDGVNYPVRAENSRENRTRNVTEKRSHAFRISNGILRIAVFIISTVENNEQHPRSKFKLIS